MREVPVQRVWSVVLRGAWRRIQREEGEKPNTRAVFSLLPLSPHLWAAWPSCGAPSSCSRVAGPDTRICLSQEAHTACSGDVGHQPYGEVLHRALQVLPYVMDTAAGLRNTDQKESAGLGSCRPGWESWHGSLIPNVLDQVSEPPFPNLQNPDCCVSQMLLLGLHKIHGVTHTASYMQWVLNEREALGV